MSDKQPKPNGRPSIYTEDLADELCARLVGSDNGTPRSLVSVCRDEDMPGFRTVMSWLDDDRFESFQHNYHRARAYREEAIFEEMRDIAASPLIGEVNITKETKDGVFDESRLSDNVQRSQLMINTAQWQLARMAPKKYGDKMQVESKVDITNHYNDDDEAILRRHAQQLLEDEAIKKSRKAKPEPQEDKQ